MIPSPSISGITPARVMMQRSFVFKEGELFATTHPVKKCVTGFTEFPNVGPALYGGPGNTMIRGGIAPNRKCTLIGRVGTRNDEASFTILHEKARHKARALRNPRKSHLL